MSIIFENEEWELVVTPRYILKKAPKKINIKCYHCDGIGSVQPVDVFDYVDNMCNWCYGRGLLEREEPPKNPAPKIDEKFLKALQNFINDYKD